MKRSYILIYGFCLALFGSLAYFAHKFSNFPADIAISAWLQGIDFPLFNPVMQAVSYIATAPASIIIVAMVSVGLLITKRKLESTLVVLLASGATMVGWLLKLLINRPRPEDGLVLVLGSNNGPSFPSGHMVYAIVFYGLLFYLTPRLIERQSRAGVLQSVLLLLAALTGISRIYLGAHWFSDVFGSLLLGSLLLVPTVVLYNKYAGDDNA